MDIHRWMHKQTDTWTTNVKPQMWQGTIKMFWLLIRSASMQHTEHKVFVPKQEEYKIHKSLLMENRHPFSMAVKERFSPLYFKLSNISEATSCLQKLSPFAK